MKTKYLFLILSLFLVTGCTEGNTTQHEDGNNTNVVENEKVTTKTPDKREEIKDVIESTLMSNPPIEKLYKDEETGRYIIEILYKKSSLGMSVCASDNQYLAKKFIGDSSIESVQFKCENSEGVFGFVKVSNIGGITKEEIDANTSYYDASMKQYNSVDKLEASLAKKYKESCKKYKYKDVLRTPSDYEDKKAYWFGKVVQVVGSNEYRITVNCEKNRYAAGGYVCDDAIYVTYYGELNLLEDDMVKMYGVMEGTYTYTTVLNSSLTIPKFYAKYVELVG